ncbi:Uncharacterised protein [Actinomyces howellii]|uniref:Uncharacterized protein n=1 Tax=Actinomyces howellii TaxID=52771 RepID=A0A3S5EGZ0_9ACTO|nr:Uncharacterised protein [Actinomyces howellii]
MCRWDKMFKSGYYSRLERTNSGRTMRRKELAVFVPAESESSDGVCEGRSIAAVLERQGV